MDDCTPTVVPFLARAITENSILTILSLGGFLNDFTADRTSIFGRLAESVRRHHVSNIEDMRTIEDIEDMRITYRILRICARRRRCLRGFRWYPYFVAQRRLVAFGASK